MKGHSESVGLHEDIPQTQEEKQRIQEAIEEARENLRNGNRTLRAYIFTVETAQDNAKSVTESIIELRGLLDALGDECAGETRQRLPKAHPPTLVGSGKAQEIAREAKAAGADYVVCDRDLSHSQVRNLEIIIRIPVLDRASIILQIFERHAKTREARVQVGIAHLEYLLPRLTSSWISAERQGGGSSGGGAARSRGSGESKLELNQRHVRERLERMRSELDRIQQERSTQRKSRRREFCVALVGYTNAGKTTLMNALTGSSLSTRDGVFETLDTTVRRMNGRGFEANVLLSDTVGFIRNLPHSLVASFRSTLQDACDADLLLQVVDASDPNFPLHIQVTDEVLSEVGAGDVARLLVLNKADKGTAAAPAHTKSESIILSARKPDDVERLRQRILEKRRASFDEVTVTLPYERAGELSRIYSSGDVLWRKDDDDGIQLRIAAPKHILAQLALTETKEET
jgi:GTP-binding protein HflX